MTILLFSNQAQTNLAYPVSNTSTTVVLAAGTASYFPDPSVGEAFKLTLVNATNNLINEIVLVTEVVGDVLTVVRAQEGTVAKTWKAGDFAVNLMTAGTGNAFTQIYGMENGLYSAQFTNMEADTGQVNQPPLNANDLVNKRYADSLSTGQYKPECQCATTEEITLFGLQTIDQYATLVDDRVVVKNQSNPALNGIYVVSTAAWHRSGDMSDWEQVPGALTFVQNGHLYANTGWAAITSETGTINVTPITWTQISGLGTYTAGTGLSLIGTQFSITNTAVVAGTYGTDARNMTLAVNAQGQITSIYDQPISIAPSQINAAIPNSGLTHSSIMLGSDTVSLGGSLTTLTGVSISGATNTLTAIPNLSLDHSSITINGNSVSLGGSTTVTAVAPYTLTIGTGLNGTSYNGSAAVTIALANTTIVAGDYGSAANFTYFSVDAQGRLTAAGTQPIAIANTQVSGLGTMSTQNSNNVSITGGQVATSALFGTVDNSQLTHSSLTINGNSISLGGSTTVTAATTSALTIGTGLSGGSFNGSSPVTVSITDTGVVADSYGNVGMTPFINVNAQGQLTSISDVAISIDPSQINAPIPNTGLANSSVTFNGQTVALGASGTITAVNPNALTIGTGLTGTSYNGSSSVTIALASVGTANTYGSAASVPVFTTNAYGQVSSVTNTPIAIAYTAVSGLGTAAVLNAGVAGGVATLDGAGTVPLSQIPASLIGAIKYQGTWDALTNTPTLTSSVGTQGYYYVVSVAGSTNLDGITDWKVGDWAIYSGTAWQKIDNTDAVSSVNGYTGTVVLDYTDVGAPSVTGTNATGTWGISISGNAATVTNGVYTTGSYADPTWLTSLATTKLTGTISNAQLDNSTISGVSLGSNLNSLTIGTGLSGVSYNGSALTTIALSNTAVSAGSYGSASSVATFTVNAQGQLTTANTTSIAIANTQVSGLGTMSTQNANNVAITGGLISLTGPLVLAASTSSLVPIHIPYGTEPTSPVTGDIWASYTGLYFKNSDNYIEQLDIGANTPGALSMPAITVTGSGSTVDVGSVDAVLFSQSGWMGDLRTYVVPAATGLALTDNSANYLVISYNAGSPTYTITTNPANINNSSVVGACLLWRSGTQVHFEAINWGLSTASRINRRLVQTDRYARASGLALGESTGNVITLSAGVVWYGVNEINELAVTSASSNADFYYHVAGVWTQSTVSTYNITQYDDGTALQTLSNGRYAVNWVYRYLDGAGLPKLAFVLGGGNYSQAQALASASPTPPPILSTMAILVGRIIVLKNAASAFEIDSAFTVTFNSTTVTDHNDLAGLQGGTSNEYFHMTNAEYTGTGSGNFVRATSPTLTTPILSTNSLVVSPVAGGEEFDGNSLYVTGDTTNGSGRQIVQSAQMAKLATSATVASGGQFFTSTVRPALLSGHLYKFSYSLIFTKATAGTVTFSFSNSAATNFTPLSAKLTLIQQGYGTTASSSMFASGAATTTQQASLSLADATGYVATIEGTCTAGANTRLQLLATCSAGTITSQLGSNFVVTDLGSSTTIGNIG